MSSKEIKEKIERIIELREEGFNVPRFCYVIKQAPDELISKALEWANQVHKQDSKQIFNIRTYNFYGQNDETINSEHIVDIPYENLGKELLMANDKYHCMVDAETPDNGRLAGNVVILEKDSFISKKYGVIIEYCIRPKRAMVRMADSHISFDLKYLNRELASLNNPVVEEVLGKVVRKAQGFSRPNQILEWTWFVGPAGEKLENLVWWEYRKYE